MNSLIVLDFSVIYFTVFFEIPPSASSLSVSNEYAEFIKYSAHASSSESPLAFKMAFNKKFLSNKLDDKS